MTRALTITTDGVVALVQLSTPPTLAELQAAVGGCIEAVALATGDTMYLNEEGKLGPAVPVVNVVATHLTRGIVADDDLIVGDVIIVGAVDDDGNDTDVSPHLEVGLLGRSI